jgi:hypothetical protein
MTIERVHFVCVCCGSRLPDHLSRQELVEMGCTLQMDDGSVVFRCLHHSDLECLKMVKAIPSFVRASEYKRYASDE